MALKVSNRSINRLESNFKGLYRDVMLNATDVMEKRAKNIMAESLTQIPKDTGAAASSRFIDEALVYQDTIIVHFGYSDETSTVINPVTGKATSLYVYEIHEQLSGLVRGLPKFLEAPTTAAVRPYIEELTRSIAQALALPRR